MACATRCQPLLPILTTLQWGGPLPFIYSQLGLPGFNFGTTPDYATGGLRGTRGAMGPMGPAMNRGGMLGKPVTSGGSPGGAGGGCICSSTDGSLKMVCCGSGSCVFDCNNTTNSLGEMIFGVCGGEPPYFWSKVGAGTLVDTGSNQATLTKPTNSGSGVAGTAFVHNVVAVNCNCAYLFSCGDTFISRLGASQGGAALTCAASPAPCCSCGNDPTVPYAITCGGAGPCGGTPTEGATYTMSAPPADKRTAGMITAGCSPCGISMYGVVITVTDNVGTSVSKTLTITI